MKSRTKPKPKAKAKKTPKSKSKSKSTAKSTAKTTPRSKSRPPAKAAKPRKRGGGGPRKMKAYASFDLYLQDQPAMHQRLITALRQFVARTAPALQESVKWGNGCWLQGKMPVSYVYAAEDYVQFGFIRGSSLADPKGLLHGDGQYVRHIKVFTLADIDEPAFRALLLQAMD